MAPSFAAPPFQTWVSVSALAYMAVAARLPHPEALAAAPLKLALLAVAMITAAVHYPTGLVLSAAYLVYLTRVSVHEYRRVRAPSSPRAAAAPAPATPVTTVDPRMTGPYDDLLMRLSPPASLHAIQDNTWSFK